MAANQLKIGLFSGGKMNSKVWYQSKTVWLNLLVVIVALLGFVVSPDFPLELGQYAEYVTLALAILNIILRFVTGQPITLKK